MEDPCQPGAEGVALWCWFDTAVVLVHYCIPSLNVVSSTVRGYSSSPRRFFLTLPTLCEGYFYLQPF